MNTEIKQLLKQNKEIINQNKFLNKELNHLVKKNIKNGQLELSKSIHENYNLIFQNNEKLKELGFNSKSLLKKLIDRTDDINSTIRVYQKKAVYSGDTKIETVYDTKIAINKYNTQNQYTLYSDLKEVLELNLENSKREYQLAVYNNLCTKSILELEKKYKKAEKDLILLKSEIISPRHRKYQKNYYAMKEFEIDCFQKNNYLDYYKLVENAESKNFKDLDDLYNEGVSFSKWLEYQKEEFEKLTQNFLQDFWEENSMELNKIEGKSKIEKIEKQAVESFQYSLFPEYKKMSDKRAVREIKALMQANVGQYNEKDKFVTLTYSNDFLDRGMNRDQVKKDIRNFVKRLGRKYNCKPEYIAVFELQNKRYDFFGKKVWHVHLALFNVPFIKAPKLLTENKNIKDEIEQLNLLEEVDNEQIKILENKIKQNNKEISNFWSYGSFDIQSAKDSNLSDYLSKYITKDFIYREFENPLKLGHRYMRSRGLFEPIKLYGDDIELFEMLYTKEDKYYLKNNFEYYHKQFDMLCNKKEFWRDEYIVKSNSKDRKKCIEEKLNKLKHLFNRFVQFLELQKNIQNLDKEEKQLVDLTQRKLFSQKYELIKEYLDKPVNDFKLILMRYISRVKEEVKFKNLDYNIDHRELFQEEKSYKNQQKIKNNLQKYLSRENTREEIFAKYR